MNALRGAAELLAAAPVVLMEYNRPYATAMGWTLDEVLCCLRRFGPYRAYEIDGRKPLDPATVADVVLIDVLFRPA